MLRLLLAGLLALSGMGIDERQAVDPAAVTANIARLKESYKSGSTADRVEALEACVKTPDADVATHVAMALKDKDATVVTAAVETLGHMRHPEALKLLEKYYSQNKKRLRKDATLFSLVLKNCARHGEDSTIQILTEDPFGVKSYEAVQARVYGLGNIRSKQSIEALIGMARKTSRNNLDRYMDEFRVALFNITGVDQGNSPDLWGIWWRDNKKTLEIPENPPELPPEMRRPWNRYWGIQSKDKAKGRKKDADR